MQLPDDLEWGLLATTQMLNGLGADVKVNALSIDDQWIVVACSNDKIYVFNTRTGLYARTLAGHKGEVTCLVLVSATEQDTLNDNHTTVNTALETSTEVSHGTVKGFRNKTAIVVSGSLDGDLRIWYLSNGQSKSIPHGDSILSLCVQDGYAITGSLNGRISICGIESGYILIDDQAFIEPVRFLQSAGQSFLSATDETTKVWNLGTSNLQTSLTDHEDHISAIGFDGRFQVSCSANLTRIWDKNTLKEYTIQSEGEITCVQMNESDFIYGTKNGTLESLCLATGKITQSFNHGQRSITCLSADKRFLASGSDDGSVKIWSLQSGCLLYELCKESQKIYKVCIKDGKCVILFKRGEKTMMDIVNFLPLGNIPLARSTDPFAASATVPDDILDYVPNAVPGAVPSAVPSAATNATSSTAPNIGSSTTQTYARNTALATNQEGTRSHQGPQISFGARLQITHDNASVHIYREDNGETLYNASLF